VGLALLGEPDLVTILGDLCKIILTRLMALIGEIRSKKQKVGSFVNFFAPAEWCFLR
jgi:hypothetical protein